MSGAGVISASTFAGQQVIQDGRCFRAVRCRQSQPRRRITCSAAPDKLVDLFTLAARTSTAPPPPPPIQPAAPTFSLPSIQAPSISPGEASAAVDSAVSGAIDLIRATGDLAKSGVDATASGAGYVKDAYDKVSPTLSDAARTATPYVKSAAKIAGDVARPAWRALQPLLRDAVSNFDNFLYSKGLNSQAIISSAKDAEYQAQGALNTASPTIKSAYSTVSAQSPTQLAEWAVGLIALYYLGPPILGFLFGGLRGYRGDISPANALDLASKQGNSVLVDIRSERDKENYGVPDLPGGRFVEVEYASVGDRRLRGQLRNAGDIERQMTVLEISSLKRVGKGTRILLLDNNGFGAKRIARELARKGFRNVYVVNGGFSGWNNQGLNVKGSASVTPDIIPPLFGTQGRSSGRRALPSGRF